MYIPLHNGTTSNRYIFKISISKLCFFTVSLPLFAFIICVMLTMFKDFEKANYTHCNVPNFIPSISASIGNYQPQSTIWQTAIFVHAIPRFFIISLRWKYYYSVIDEDFLGLVNLAVFLNILENLSLLGLTYWTSALFYRK